MKKTFDFPRREARADVWLDELPTIEKQAESVVELAHIPVMRELGAVSNVAISIMIHNGPMFTGLVGGTFEPDNDGQFRIQLSLGTALFGAAADDPDILAKVVTNGLQAANAAERLGSGLLKLDRLADGSGVAAPNIFERLVSAVVDLMASDAQNPDTAQLASIIAPRLWPVHYAVLPDDLIADLADAGISVNSMHELLSSKTDRLAATSVLIKWLPLVVDKKVKMGLVSAMQIKEFQSEALPVLLAEFSRLDSEHHYDLKMIIAGKIAQVAEDAVFEEIAAAVQDSRHGNSRINLLDALRRMPAHREQAIEILTNLLAQNEMPFWAIKTLADLGATECRPLIEKYASSETGYVRDEAVTALADLDKVTQRKIPK